MACVISGGFVHVCVVFYDCQVDVMLYVPDVQIFLN